MNRCPICNRLMNVNHYKDDTWLYCPACKHTEEKMESPYNGKSVNGHGVKPNAWYCDICGGHFTVEDSGFISNETDICSECHERGFDSAKGEIIN